MKNYLLFLALLFLITIAACKKQNRSELVVGSWKVSSFTVSTLDSNRTVVTNPASSNIYSKGSTTSVSGSTGKTFNTVQYQPGTSPSVNLEEIDLKFSGNLTINSDGTFTYAYSSQKTNTKNYLNGQLQNSTADTLPPTASSGKGVWEWGATQNAYEMLKLKDVNLGSAFGQPFDAFKVINVTEDMLELGFETAGTTTSYPSASTTVYAIKNNSVNIKLTK